ncbi:hypothetical protein KCU67_g8969, partial [Aureobasidium melanogenum]
NALNPSKTQLLDNLTALQRQINSAPSRKDYDDAKDNIKRWDTFWAGIEPELTQLRTQKIEMDSFAAKAADYNRLKLMEAAMKAEMEKHTKEFAAKQADYDRLKAIEQQLIANDGEYKDLLRKSNQVQSDANELIELRTRSGQMQDDEDELQALRQQHEQRRNTQQITGPSVFTAPEAALDPVDPVDPFALYQTVIGVQADIHERFLNNMLDETTSAIASSAARAGAQAYISAVSAGQTEADAVAAAEQAADTAAAERRGGLPL